MKDDMSVGNFGIGQPVRRTEDPTLVRGEGRYTDDIDLAGQAYAFIVRSPLAHGILRGIDLDAARAMPGVLMAFDAAELASAGYGALKTRLPYHNRDGSAMQPPPRLALAHDKVRYVGDPVACIIAETLWQAKDAAEAVGLDIEELPAVTSTRAAADKSAPLLYEEIPGNLQLDYYFGDTDAIASAFAKAHHVTRVALSNNRLIVNPMEPRSAIAEYDGVDLYTLHTCSQGVMGIKGQLVNDVLPKGAKARVLTGNVGGSFGMKIAVYPEYVCALHGARQLGRPVKWTDERSTSFLSDAHGRDATIDAELALDAEGRFLALRIAAYANVGAHVSVVGPLPATRNFVINALSQYRTPLIEVSVKCMVTNSTPIGPYRGAGRPEGNYFMERLIDAAAAELDIDRIELRRRNQIAAQELPFTAASGVDYDSGDFAAVLNKALAAADWNGFAARKAASAKQGLLRGRGIGCFLEATAGPMPEMGGIRFEEDGTVTILTGTLDYGQGHAAAFAQVLSSRLGIPFAQIRLMQGDSDQLLAGSGTGGSRSIMNSGAAILVAADEVEKKGREIASHVLEAAPADIEFASGAFRIAGTDRAIGIVELAAKLRNGLALPPGAPDTLDVSHLSKGEIAAYPNGCHICEVEIDPETGIISLGRYVSVNDFGTIINPLLVAGQIHGGVAQGVGQALMERVVYDEHGQLLTGSFMDYQLPRAADLPDIGFASHPVPATTNLLGAKGCGEAGCAGSITSVMSAVVDALADLGIRHVDMPATPEIVWRAIQEARPRQAAE
ncbi:MAG: xanthine dehydrogenase family protein molybdopterin-binding subunit [Beijerinckiaceae bacterium]